MLTFNNNRMFKIMKNNVYRITKNKECKIKNMENNSMTVIIINNSK